MVNYNKWNSAWPNLLYEGNLHNDFHCNFKIAGYERDVTHLNKENKQSARKLLN